MSISVSLNHTVSKRVVDLHGGELSVYSEGEGCGCIFTLTLPLLPTNVCDEISDLGSINRIQAQVGTTNAYLDSARSVGVKSDDEKSDDDMLSSIGSPPSLVMIK